MARFAGKGGSVTFGGAVQGGITGWTLNIEGQAIETTGMDDSGRRTYIRGLSGWSGSAEGHWDSVVNLGYAEAEAVAAAIQLDGGGSGAPRYSGNALISNYSATSAVDGGVDFSFDYQGTAALTEGLVP